MQGAGEGGEEVQAMAERVEVEKGEGVQVVEEVVVVVVE